MHRINLNIAIDSPEPLFGMQAVRLLAAIIDAARSAAATYDATRKPADQSDSRTARLVTECAFTTSVATRAPADADVLVQHMLDQGWQQRATDQRIVHSSKPEAPGFNDWNDALRACINIGTNIAQLPEGKRHV